MVTPVHIMPEWYFLFAYAILRVIPRKLGGVLGLVASIAVLYLFPLFRKFTKATAYNAPYQVMFWGYVRTFLILTWLGGCPIEDPYITTSAVFSGTYFALVGSLMFLA
jgi:ubiquinol-cytochrome c reductase cytochrome b subunit